MDLLSFDAWAVGMQTSGYAVSKTAKSALLYEAPGKKAYRLSPFEPNASTKAWMDRNSVQDSRCQPDARFTPWESDLPEFGLEVFDPYHDDTQAISKSMLSVFLDEGAVAYYHQFLTGLMPRKKVTRQIKMGAICHTILLDRKRHDEAYEVYPDSCYSSGDTPRLIAKRAEAFERRIAPKVAVRASMVPQIVSTIENARKSEFGKMLELHSDKVLYETRVDEEIEGLPCKCRPDICIVMSDQLIVPDLKFGAFLPDDFWRSAKRFRYILQQNHYTRILEKRHSLPVSWSFWAFETEFPFRVEPRWYDARSIEIGASFHRDALRDLRKCYESGVWEDNFKREGTVAPWEMERPDQDESPEESTEMPYEDRDYEVTDLTLENESEEYEEDGEE